MSTYRDLSIELRELRKNYKPENNKRIKEIDSLLKKADKAVGRFTTSHGNYVLIISIYYIFKNSYHSSFK